MPEEVTQRVDTYLSFAMEYTPEVRETAEALLKKHGYPLEQLDLSDRACLLLTLCDGMLFGAPPRVLDALAQAVSAPTKARSSVEKLHRWLMNHWHKARVRNEADRLFTNFWTVGPFRRAGLTAQAVSQEIEKYQHPLLVVIWSAYNSPDPNAIEITRQHYGANLWDGIIQTLCNEVRPSLWVMLTRYEVERLLERKSKDRKLEALAAQVKALAWEADEAKERHNKATQKVSALKGENDQLRQKLAERDKRIAELEATMTEERQMFAEVLVMLQEIRTKAADHNGAPAARPLTGKNILIVGGDPIADFSQLLIQALGGTPHYYSGLREIGRLQNPVRPHAVLVNRSCLTHSHDALVMAFLKDNPAVPKVYINQKGISAVRRALNALVEVLHRPGNTSMVI